MTWKMYICKVSIEMMAQGECLKTFRKGHLKWPHCFDVKKKWHVKLQVANIIYKVTWSSRYIGVNPNLPTYKIRDRRSFWTVSAFVSLSVAERIEGLMNQHVSFYMVDFLLGNQEANIAFQALDLQMSAQKRDHDPFAHVKKHALTRGVQKGCKCMMIFKVQNLSANKRYMCLKHI